MLAQLKLLFCILIIPSLLGCSSKYDGVWYYYELGRFPKIEGMMATCDSSKVTIDLIDTPLDRETLCLLPIASGRIQFKNGEDFVLLDGHEDVPLAIRRDGANLKMEWGLDKNRRQLYTFVRRLPEFEELKRQWEEWAETDADQFFE